MSRHTAHVHRLLIALLAIVAAVGVVVQHPQAVRAAPLSEVEPNDSLETAQPLPAIGADAPMLAQANDGGDVDWFRFEGVAGRTYLVELFNVARAFEARGNGCTTFVGGSAGIGLGIYDALGTQILVDCDPGGAGNAHHYVQFKAGLSGTFYIHVAPGGNSVTGTYSLRVLPNHDAAEASWNPATYEPNNVAIAAYALKAGRAGALTSSIEERNSSYSTNRVDQDWYRFEGVAGETYTVELFDVKLTNDRNGNGCTTFVGGSRGIGLEVYGPALEPILSECSPSGSGNVHHRRQFKAGLDGTFYIHVAPGGNDVSGTYGLRVLTPSDAFRAFLPLVRR